MLLEGENLICRPPHDAVLEDWMRPQMQSIRPQTEQTADTAQSANLDRKITPNTVHECEKYGQNEEHWVRMVIVVARQSQARSQKQKKWSLPLHPALEPLSLLPPNTRRIRCQVKHSPLCSKEKSAVTPINTSNRSRKLYQLPR